MDIINIIILAVIVIALAADLVYIFRRRKRNGSCCGDCSACFRHNAEDSCLRKKDVTCQVKGRSGESDAGSDSNNK